jgi:hypothetical protein
MNQLTVRLALPMSTTMVAVDPIGRWFLHHRELARHATHLVVPKDHEPWAGSVAVLIRWFATFPPMALESAIVTACKPYLAGAQHAGLFVNDRQISGFTVERGYDRERPRVELLFSCEEG